MVVESTAARVAASTVVEAEAVTLADGEDIHSWTTPINELRRGANCAPFFLAATAQYSRGRLLSAEFNTLQIGAPYSIHLIVDTMTRM